MGDTELAPRDGLYGRTVNRLRWLFVYTPEIAFMTGFVAGTITLLVTISLFGLGARQQINNTYFDVQPVFYQDEQETAIGSVDIYLCADTYRIRMAGKSSQEDARE